MTSGQGPCERQTGAAQECLSAQGPPSVPAAEQGLLTPAPPPSALLFVCKFSPQKSLLGDQHSTATELQLIGTAVLLGRKICPKELEFLVSTFRFNVHAKEKHPILLIKKQEKEAYEFWNKSWKLLFFQDTKALENIIYAHDLDYTKKLKISN